MEGPGGGAPGADTASAVVDAGGVIRAWSPGAERLLGHAATDVVGRSAGPLLGQAPPAAAPGPEGWRGTLRLRHRAGHTVAAQVAASPLQDGGGEPRWLLLATEAARPAEDPLTMLALAYEQSGESLAIYDVRGHVLWANATVRRHLGLTEEEMIGRPIDALFAAGEDRHPDNPFAQPDSQGARALRDVAERLREVGRDGRQIAFEVTAGTAENPQAITWAVNVSPIRDASGVVRGVFVVSVDVTEQARARDRLTLLKEAGDRIGGTLDVTTTAQELADILVPSLCDFAIVDLLPPVATGGEPTMAAERGGYTMHRAAQRSLHEGVPEAALPVGRLDRYPDYSPPARALATGGLVLSDLDDPDFSRWLREDPERRARAETYGFRTMMTVPLRARGIVLGIARLLRTRPDTFVGDDLVLAEELCARAAVSIDNARRYARERGTALALQRSLLPRQLQGQIAVDVASRYRPAAGRMGVGGDWFDVVPLSGTRVALVIGDVVGHGVHASATMGRLRTAVRTLADVDLPPDELLTHLDDLVSHLAEQEEAADPSAATIGEVGATCLYAVYDPVSRICAMASAGHPPPVITGPDGTAIPVDISPGPPLGVGGLPFEATQVVLPEGSLVALSTNGLITPRGRAIEQGQRLLHDALAEPAGSLDEICDRALGELLPERQTDDAALLLARTRALDARHVATLDLAAEPALVATARKAAAEQLVAWDLTEAAFVTELVVSELVTNAIRHAEPPIQLRLLRGETSLIIEVSDGSSTAPHLRRARTFDEGGRGLLLVAQLTQQWGTRQTASGKTIWAEQQLSGQP
ncbi:SpoIIE family protein phosphatase [Streptomyces millisiae]|uniref:SpoIIE family protein phosphatase n=1 Tax=Streptomyces millisiae TaxID=3075542 RepID=A0ABU2M007_9ACTN|nr:SpoIIE family protein phosphatase [Streptomyces sp. DSM 44918]MDT0323186.1 SpoIIE family protein phosphatase [Streptomyces sp. DSM 44918]